MKILINDNKTILTLREEFNHLFPYLKLEIFSKPHQPTEASAKKFIIDPSKTLNECRTSHYCSEIAITPDMSVSELEQSFNNAFGLSVQVFRKSGKVWLETTVTDGWTLEEQNKQGERLSKTYV